MVIDQGNFHIVDNVIKFTNNWELSIFWGADNRFFLGFVLELFSTEKCIIFILYMISQIILRTFKEKKLYLNSMSLSLTIGDSLKEGQNSGNDFRIVYIQPYPNCRAQDDPLKGKMPLFLFFLIKILQFGVTQDLLKWTKDQCKLIQHGYTFVHFTSISG